MHGDMMLAEFMRSSSRAATDGRGGPDGCRAPTLISGPSPVFSLTRRDEADLRGITLLSRHCRAMAPCFKRRHTATNARHTWSVWCVSACLASPAGPAAVSVRGNHEM